MQNQTADLSWSAEGVPVSNRFDDPYFSLQNGLEETRHVFLQGNRLPERFAPGFRIAELGFGTGLNFLATVQAWQGAGAPGDLSFTSLEAFPMSAEEMATALRPFGELGGLRDQLTSRWSEAGGPIDFGPGVRLEVIIGDVRTTLPCWHGAADAWYLDGFSPAKNPDMWSEDLMQMVAARTAPGGTVATYSAAGAVRRALADAGFSVQRVPGFGRKRHMTVGSLAT
ncbi:FAD-dependent oxidoreductase [Roseobacter cerasinus]|uniref:FAD-dependent oxidoreductase n=1 Tax=Roseobacter cerasinus TaxID=2602289 RepID=A0A640VRV9_9RHOB|nr:tRNA (5-methylaminomethyl-2-thiouridine)(34)-methyltransferase MnmD [Roseobacter cerasinus]GFE48946.1 FAD-dependent oxidoreductase [Roseobacter cerasinus]